MKTQTFENIKQYLQNECNLSSSEFRISMDINNIEFFVGKEREYFISVGEYDKGIFEVFAHSVGAEWDDNDFCIKDGKLIQYKIYKSLKKAVNFAVKCLKEGQLPNQYLKMW